MRRVRGAARPDGVAKIHEQGLIYDTPSRYADGSARPYFDESIRYEFTMDEVLALESQVELMHSMCLEAVEHVILTERFADFGIPEYAWQPIADSWRRGDPHVYGRFDFRYDGSGPAKLLEYNADTPTSLLEASIIQWYWKQDVHPEADQWNGLHEALVARWGELKSRMPGADLYFCWSGADPTGEDHMTTAYLQETAAEAGFSTVGLQLEQVGWDTELRRFTDLEMAPMEAVFKLYPWEWIFEDEFGVHVVEQSPKTLWVEPLWKAILSNKAILAILWEMYPGHPNLLPAFIDDPGLLTEYIRKPKLGREGANMSIVDLARGTQTETAGVYGREGYVYQLFDPLPEFDGYRPVLGTWVVGDEAAGLGIRETSTLITDDGAAFIPHIIPDP